MKQKAFTLAELMGVIVIIGIIATIVTLTIDRNIKSSREKTCLAQEKSIIEAAKTWSIDNPNSLPTNENSHKTLLIDDLQTGGYLDEDLKNPMTGNEYTYTYVKIAITEGNTDYTYTIEYPNSKEKCKEETS